jgi:hypothetical protein
MTGYTAEEEVIENAKNFQGPNCDMAELVRLELAIKKLTCEISNHQL